jgi:hypothetical protein
MQAIMATDRRAKLLLPKSNSAPLANIRASAITNSKYLFMAGAFSAIARFDAANLAAGALCGNFAPEFKCAEVAGQSRSAPARTGRFQ